jgi:hypothetical protein
MSGVRATKSLIAQPSVASGVASLQDDVQVMQDILYDILANGIDPERSEVPTQAVERFLFEHARAPKSREEFRTFFAAHGLNVGMRAAPEPPLRLPPIQRPSADAGMPAQLPVELASAPSPATVLQLTPPPLPARSRKPALLGLWAGLAILGCALVAGAYYGYSTIVELRADLQREAQQGHDDRQELKALRDHAAGLESSVAATGELIQRMDQKSDLLINSLVPAPSSHSRRE